MELVPALPDDPSTTSEAGEVRVGAVELGGEYAGRRDSPCETVEPPSTA